MGKNWVEKYRPKRFSEIKGQELAVEKITEFIDKFPKNKKKAIVLHGPPGVGKTTLAHVISLEKNSEIFELNASDLRNKKKLQAILRPAMEQRSLLKEKKIILVDEVDGISVADWGGLAELMSLIEKTNFPVIITANDIWSQKLNVLRKKSELIQLKEINYNLIKDILIQVLRSENKFIDNDTITKISIRAKGDMRAALNDLQTVAGLETPSEMVLDERNKEIDIFNAMRLIFKNKPTNDLLSLFDSVKMSLDDIILWMEENISAEYSGEELAKAFEMLSKVDVFKGRIYKQQYWRFMVYENIFLSYGISAAKKDIKTGFTNYQKPTRKLKIWLNNQRSKKKKTIAEKYAKHVHVSQKRAMNEFPIIKQILTSNDIRKELRLDEEEIAYLEK
ncbi:replication factor C large subunit [Candidatus Pacearchaeota archaeon]|nr:replication factor C large subunit [Candidatus Pacearchaeota archaeon]